MFLKGLIVYGWGLVVTFLFFAFIFLELYEFGLYACFLTLFQIGLLGWLVVEHVLEIRKGTKKH